MNIEHLNEWLTALRSGEYEQGQETLALSLPASDVIRYCCLGLGSKVAGIECHREQFTDDGEPVIRETFGSHSAQDLAPLEFVRWLDVPLNATRTQGEYDLVLDWPEDWGTQDPPDRASILYRHDSGYGGSRTLSALNDAGLTFPQIADLIEYIGIKEAS